MSEEKNKFELRNCTTCGHRIGKFKFGKCALSGSYCTIERKYPSRCGVDFQGWTPMPKRKGLRDILKLIWNGK